MILRNASAPLPLAFKSTNVRKQIPFLIFLILLSYVLEQGGSQRFV